MKRTLKCRVCGKVIRYRIVSRDHLCSECRSNAKKTRYNYGGYVNDRSYGDAESRYKKRKEYVDNAYKHIDHLSSKEQEIYLWKECIELFEKKYGELK